MITVVMDGTFFVGEWYDDQNSLVTVGDGQHGQFQVIIRKDGVPDRLLTLQQRLDVWKCGDFSLEASRNGQIIWRNEGDERIWRRPTLDLLALKDRELARKDRELARSRQDVQHLTEQLAIKDHELARKDREFRAVLPVSPYMQAVAEFMHQISDMQPSVVDIPVAALRFTQHDVDGGMTFSAGEHQGESVYKLVDDLLRGAFTLHKDSNDCCRLFPSELGPLDVFLYDGPDGYRGLYCTCNRRLLALLFFQAVRRDTTVYVQCRVHNVDSYDPSPAGALTLEEWFNERYSYLVPTLVRHVVPTLVRQRTLVKGLGLSTFPRPGVSTHFGERIF